MFFNDVLIPIKFLVNGTTIVQVAQDDVAYWHVELERHDVIFAEGLPCESYLDTDNRSAFANGGPAVQMHANFALGADDEAVWEAAGYAPLCAAGEKVDRLAARLRRRAKRLGFVATRCTKRHSRGSGKGAREFAGLLRPDWYLANHPDVAAAGIDAARHYTVWGRHEGRLPCPERDLVRALALVDAGTVAFTMSDVLAGGGDPVEHFCSLGWRERRRPNLYFDTGWYLDTHSVPTDMNPLVHYILRGESDGLAPSRHFDPVWYRQRYALGPAESPLAHYLKHRRTQLYSPLAIFPLAEYLRANKATLRPGRDPYAHFLASRRFMVSGREPIADAA